MRRVLGLVALVPATALLATLLHGCGDADADDVSSPPAAEETTLADCAALIPDDVLEGLGWTASATPTLDSATCSLGADQGTLSVARRPVPGTSSDDLPEAGQEEFDERCADLSDGQAGHEVDWLGSDAAGCAVVTGDGSGINVLLAVSDAGLLVESRVTTDQPTASAAQVQAALAELAQTALQRLA